MQFSIMLERLSLCKTLRLLPVCLGASQNLQQCPTASLIMSIMGVCRRGCTLGDAGWQTEWKEEMGRRADRCLNLCPGACEINQSSKALTETQRCEIRTVGLNKIDFTYWNSVLFLFFAEVWSKAIPAPRAKLPLQGVCSRNIVY